MIRRTHIRTKEPPNYGDHVDLFQPRERTTLIVQACRNAGIESADYWRRTAQQRAAIITAYHAATEAKEAAEKARRKAAAIVRKKANAARYRAAKRARAGIAQESERMARC